MLSPVLHLTLLLDIAFPLISSPTGRVSLRVPVNGVGEGHELSLFPLETWSCEEVLSLASRSLPTPRCKSQLLTDLSVQLSRSVMSDSL